jgi:xanthine dehydrogenase accessory factor
MTDVLDVVRQMQLAGERGLLATVVEVVGSTPSRVGGRMVVRPGGRIEGTVGGGALEHRVMALAEEVVAGRTPRLVRFDLEQDLGMGCGGHVTVFLEPIGLADRLYIFGAGHIGEHLCELGARCGFWVTVCDERDELRTPERFPRAARLSDAAAPDQLERLGLTGHAEDAYVVVVTHSHTSDFSLVAAILPLAPTYLGMVGSRRKRTRLEAQLREAGADEAAIHQIRCPAGIALGGPTPAEIAVSIVAELVAHRAQRTAQAEADAKTATVIDADAAASVVADRTDGS